MQYIAIFGQVMKIDEEFEIEVGPLAGSRSPYVGSRIASHGRN